MYLYSIAGGPVGAASALDFAFSARVIQISHPHAMPGFAMQTLQLLLLFP